MHTDLRTKNMRSLIKAFKSLSDETRLRILNVLLERECCVCEVMQALQISQPRASRNLRILYEAGFLKVRREGLWMLYSIGKEGLGEYLPYLLEALKGALGENQLVARDRERLKRAERMGPNATQRRLGKRE